MDKQNSQSIHIEILKITSQIKYRAQNNTVSKIILSPTSRAIHHHNVVQQTKEAREKSVKTRRRLVPMFPQL